MKPFVWDKNKEEKFRYFSIWGKFGTLWFLWKKRFCHIYFFLKGKLTSAIRITFNLIPFFLSVMTCFIYVYVISFRVDQTASQMARLELILSCVFGFLLTFALVGKSALLFIWCFKAFLSPQQLLLWVLSAINFKVSKARNASNKCQPFIEPHTFSSLDHIYCISLFYKKLQREVLKIIIA